MVSVAISKATPEDIPEMYAILKSASASSLFFNRVFPTTDPLSERFHLQNISTILPTCIKAIDPTTGSILGWCFWARKEAPLPPPATFDKIMFPPSGDPDLGLEFFTDGRKEIVDMLNGKSHWHVSMVFVSPEAQRRGVGSALMGWGIERADEDGWAAALSANSKGSLLYERFGFETSSVRDMGSGIVVTYMMREPRASG